MKNIFVICVFFATSCSYKLFTRRTVVQYEKNGYLVYTPIDEVLFFFSNSERNNIDFLLTSPSNGFRLSYYDNPEMKSECDTVIIAPVNLGSLQDTIYITKAKVGFMLRNLYDKKEPKNTLQVQIENKDIYLNYALWHNKKILYFRKGENKFYPVVNRIPHPY